MKLRFEEEHLRRFSAASLDLSPLHMSQEYAQKTSSGERVVHGVLGLLACLREVAVPSEHIPSEVRIDFKSPLLLGVDYEMRVESHESAVRIALLDGSATVMRARLRFRRGNPAALILPETGTAPRQDARRLPGADLREGLSLSGAYAPPHSAYHELIESLALDREAWGDALPLALLCTSYMTGMELPGESATYSGLRLKILAEALQAPFCFRVTVDSYDERFRLLNSHFELATGAVSWAAGEISAIARPERSPSGLSAREVGSGRFTGRVAVVIGASRGLGAAMALEIAAEGGIVIGVYARSRDDAADLLDAGRRLPGHLILEQGDASDPACCTGLKNRILAEFGRLDLLVCNAAPPIHPLRIEPACYERIGAYVKNGFALVNAPLSSFLELLSNSNGCALIVSSSAVEEPPPLWPHYVAMKTAVEGLARAAAVGHAEVTFWIARPPRLLTDLSDTPLGRLDAEPAADAARRILENVFRPGTTSGQLNICR